VTSDVTEAARLVSFAARPRANPVREDDYGELVRRYLGDPVFAEVVDQVAVGLGLELRVDPFAGVVAHSDSGGPFQRRLSDIIKSRPGRNPDETRLLFGLTLLGVARTAFPQAAHLSDRTRIAQITPEAVVAYLDRLAEEIGAGAGDAEAGREEAEEGWRSWAHLREIRAGMERHSTQDKIGLVRRVCTFLEEDGHLTRKGEGNAITWSTTPRFRHAVHNLVTDSEIVPTLRAMVAVDLLPAGDVDPEDLQP